mmetsp:Transcript_7582/g.32051  ORF Transcript_7582/g.32051 Transcript_7582/m.32051 type:complete len:213 (+) Transcript_7582:1535-2173(+)
MTPATASAAALEWRRSQRTTSGASSVASGRECPARNSHRLESSATSTSSSAIRPRTSSPARTRPWPGASAPISRTLAEPLSSSSAPSTGHPPRVRKRPGSSSCAGRTCPSRRVSSSSLHAQSWMRQRAARTLFAPSHSSCWRDSLTKSSCNISSSSSRHSATIAPSLPWRSSPPPRPPRRQARQRRRFASRNWRRMAGGAHTASSSSFLSVH